MRIDRSDPADGPDHVHIARRVRSATDELDATGTDKGTVVDGDGYSESSPARSDSALRTEQSAAYPARVRAIYQQYAIDHGYARAERLERETATLAGPECRPAAVENRLKGEVSSAEAADLPEGYTSSPALKGDPYHPDSVASRSTVNQELYAATSRDRAAALGYTTRIPAQKAPFDSHGQEVFTNGKNYITSDVDGHNVTDGWKMFNKRGARIGTYDSELHYVKE